MDCTRKNDVQRLTVNLSMYWEKFVRKGKHVLCCPLILFNEDWP
jgi:hypothetical protein